MRKEKSKAQQTSSQEVFEYVCPEYITHGITGEERKCGKVIKSFYKGQFDYWVAEHKAKHLSMKNGKSTTENLRKVQKEMEVPA